MPKLLWNVERCYAFDVMKTKKFLQDEKKPFFLNEEHVNHVKPTF